MVLYDANALFLMGEGIFFCDLLGYRNDLTRCG